MGHRSAPGGMFAGSAAEGMQIRSEQTVVPLAEGDAQSPRRTLELHRTNRNECNPGKMHIEVGSKRTRTESVPTPSLVDLVLWCCMEESQQAPILAKSVCEHLIAYTQDDDMCYSPKNECAKYLQQVAVLHM